MTPEARNFIVKCFFGKVTATEVAYAVNNTKANAGAKINRDHVRAVWDEERESNSVIRLFEEKHGERPVNGYAQTDETRALERLVAV